MPKITGENELIPFVLNKVPLNYTQVHNYLIQEQNNRRLLDAIIECAALYPVFYSICTTDPELIKEWNILKKSSCLNLLLNLQNEENELMQALIHSETASFDTIAQIYFQNQISYFLNLYSQENDTIAANNFLKTAKNYSTLAKNLNIIISFPLFQQETETMTLKFKS